MSDLSTRLAKLRSGGQPVVSCYVRLEPRDRSRSKYLIALKNAARTASQTSAGLERGAREVLERDLARVIKAVETPARLPKTPGLAIFACEPLRLFEMVPLPAVHRTRLSVDERPLVRELAETEQSFGRLLLVVTDRAHARFFEVSALETKELTSLRSSAMRGHRFHSDRQGSPGWGEHDYHNRIREEKHRHFAAVAHRIEEFERANPTAGVVVAGPGWEAREVARFLSPDLARKLLGTTRLTTSELRPADARAAALAVRAEFNRTHDRATVEAMEKAAGNGWAVNGARPTLRALSRGQLRHLLIPESQTGSGYRCSTTGRLVLAKADCRGEGETIPVPDLINEAIEEAMRQRVTVSVIHDQEAQEAIDGLAGFLRFR
jgi:peptide subunit release factor 1 (eRF1)